MSTEEWKQIMEAQCRQIVEDYEFIRECTGMRLSIDKFAECWIRALADKWRRDHGNWGE